MVIDPVVRQLVLCDQVVPNVKNPLKHDALGLIHSIIAHPPGRFPVTVPPFCVYLQLTGGRGRGVVQIVAVEADSDEPVFGTPAHAVTWPADPLLLIPMVFHISQCSFPRAGVYWIQFRHDDRELAAQPILVR